MGGEILFILIVLIVGVIAAAVMLIAGILKLVLTVTGTSLRLATRPFRCNPHRSAPPRMTGLLAHGSAPGHCPRDGCGVMNPPHARFCRRCGKSLTAPQSAASQFRRAAMW